MAQAAHSHCRAIHHQPNHMVVTSSFGASGQEWQLCELDIGWQLLENKQPQALHSCMKPVPSPFQSFLSGFRTGWMKVDCFVCLEAWEWKMAPLTNQMLSFSFRLHFSSALKLKRKRSYPKPRYWWNRRDTKDFEKFMIWLNVIWTSKMPRR